jgi:hypothetical protein
MTEAATLEELTALKAQLQAARAERDAAVSALDRRELEAAEQQRLLVEEQDRFVTRIIEKYEQQIARLQGEHDAAVSIAEQLRHKVERFRRDATRAEEKVAHLESELELARMLLQGALGSPEPAAAEETPNVSSAQSLIVSKGRGKPSRQPTLPDRAVGMSGPTLRQPNSSTADGVPSSRH